MELFLFGTTIITAGVGAFSVLYYSDRVRELIRERDEAIAMRNEWARRNGEKGLLVDEAIAQRDEAREQLKGRL